MHPSWANQQWKSRESFPARYRDSRSTHRVCLLPSPIFRPTLSDPSNLTPAGHQVLLLAALQWQDLTKECGPYSTRAFACPYSTSHPLKGTWGGRGSIHAEKREDSEILALQVHDDLGCSVHETCSRPRKDGQM